MTEHSYYKAMIKPDSDILLCDSRCGGLHTLPTVVIVQGICLLTGKAGG